MVKKLEDGRETVIQYAKKTFAALKNPCRSVVKVFPSAIDAFLEEGGPAPRYVGVKDRAEVPAALIRKLRAGNYRLHTLDAASDGGRAVDLHLTNPVSGRPMTGSSSGTAINVRLHINDLGVGVDGGGSVLAPAMSVNLYGFVSPLIERGTMDRFSKESTDHIAFSPSVGFMTREYGGMLRAVRCALGISAVSGGKTRVFLPEDTGEQRASARKIRGKLDPALETQAVPYPRLTGDRKTAIRFLSEQLERCDVLISYEGPIDTEGFGDTVFGHFDSRTALCQQNSHKGLIRVVNMVKATALAVPDTDFACGYVLVCKSKPEKIAKMLGIARCFATEEDPLLKTYFTRFACYFPEEFGMDF